LETIELTEVDIISSLDQSGGDKNSVEYQLPNPDDMNEVVLHETMLQALNLPPHQGDLIGIRHDFFRSGGNSLSAIEWIALYRSRCNAIPELSQFASIPVNIEVLQQNPSVLSLNQFLQNKIRGNKVRNNESIGFMPVINPLITSAPLSETGTYPVCHYSNVLLKMNHAERSVLDRTVSRIGWNFKRQRLLISDVQQAVNVLCRRHPALMGYFEWDHHSQSVVMKWNPTNPQLQIHRVSTFNEAFERCDKHYNTNYQSQHHWSGFYLNCFGCNQEVGDVLTEPARGSLALFVSHALCDGYSTTLIRDDFVEIFEAIANGTEVNQRFRTPEGLTFFHFSVAEQEWVKQVIFTQSKAHWHQYWEETKARLPSYEVMWSKLLEIGALEQLPVLDPALERLLLLQQLNCHDSGRLHFSFLIKMPQGNEKGQKEWTQSCPHILDYLYHLRIFELTGSDCSVTLQTIANRFTPEMLSCVGQFQNDLLLVSERSQFPSTVRAGIDYLQSLRSKHQAHNWVDVRDEIPIFQVSHEQHFVAHVNNTFMSYFPGSERMIAERGGEGVNKELCFMTNSIEDGLQGNYCAFLMKHYGTEVNIRIILDSTRFLSNASTNPQAKQHAFGATIFFVSLIHDLIKQLTVVPQ
jgi:hypothetical protein